MKPSRQIMRAAVLAASLCTIWLLSSTSAWSQVGVCNCPTVPVTVSAGVLCNVTLCFEGASDRCITCVPGTTTLVGCENNMKVFLVNCKGVNVPVNPCVHTVQVVDGCCVDVCITSTGAGCYAISVTPSAVDCACG